MSSLVTYWTDPVAGVDGPPNDGSASLPWKSVDYAWSVLPQTTLVGGVQVPVTGLIVNVGAGVDTVPAELNGRVLLGGVTLNGAPLTVSGSFTLTAATQGGFGSKATVTVSSAGWTADQWKGRFIKFTGGSNRGSFYVVDSNTADTLTLEGVTVFAPSPGDTFDIYDWASILQPPSTSSSLALEIESGLYVRCTNMKFVGKIAAVGLYGNYTTLSAQYCSIGSTAHQAIGFNSGSNVQLDHCYCYGSGAYVVSTTNNQYALGAIASLNIASSKIESTGNNCPAVVMTNGNCVISNSSVTNSGTAPTATGIKLTNTRANFSGNLGVMVEGWATGVNLVQDSSPLGSASVVYVGCAVTLTKDASCFLL